MEFPTNIHEGIFRIKCSFARLV